MPADFSSAAASPSVSPASSGAARPRLILGVSGASGVIYGVRMLALLPQLGIESHLILSRAAERTLVHETGLRPDDLRAQADYSYSNEDIGAGPASGSFRSLGMVIAPCSIRTLSAIAGGVTDSLLSRAADVTLKERRRLVLMVRETPLHLGHLRSMVAATESGAIIAPPVPAFYAHPESLDAMVAHSIGRVLDLFGLDSGTVQRWREPES